MRRSCSLLLIATAACLPTSLPANPPRAEEAVERTLAPGSLVRMDLSAGGYRIRAGHDPDKLRVTWSTRHSGDRDRVRVKAETSGREAELKIRGPRDGFQVVIELPARTDLDVDMSAGELVVQGIEGNKHLELNAGEMVVEVGSPNDYRTARGSVRIGELKASPFGVHKEGFFRTFRWEGPGSYRLSARLGVGELRIR